MKIIFTPIWNYNKNTFCYHQVYLYIDVTFVNWKRLKLTTVPTVCLQFVDCMNNVPLVNNNETEYSDLPCVPFFLSLNSVNALWSVMENIFIQVIHPPPLHTDVQARPIHITPTIATYSRNAANSSVGGALLFNCHIGHRRADCRISDSTPMNT